MKINAVKTILVFGISVVLGLVCYVIAQESDSRNLISLVVSAISIFLCLGASVACEYNCGHRNANIKVTSWIFSVLVILTNVIISCFQYNVVIYIAVVALLTLMNIAIVYSLHKPQGE